MEFIAHNLEKTYGGTRALDIEYLGVTSGEFLALLGKNGSGKSTLMRLLGQQELLDAGTLTLDGASLLSTKLRLNDRVAFLSEDQSLPFARSIRRWSEIYQRIYNGYDVGVYEDLRRRLDVDDQKTLSALSRGQRIKALFILEAGRRPDAYLLDEITAVLDSGSRWSVVEFLTHEVKRGCLVVMSTNIASELQGSATRLVILNGGRVLFTTPVGQIKMHFQKFRDSPDLQTMPEGARRIARSEDGSGIYLWKSADPLPAGAVADRREISINDVQSYFTTEGVGL